MSIQPDENGIYSKTLTIVDFDPEIEDVTSISEFVRDFKDYSGSNNPKQVVFKTIDRINKEVTHLKKSDKYATNVRQIKEALTVASDIPDANALIFGTTSSTNNILETYVPLSLLEIFNTWDRIRNDEYYPKGQGIPSGNEASGWYWDDNINSMVINANTTGHMGFISSSKYDNYIFEVTVTSPESDDDGNGIIMAFVRNGNINEQLIAMVSAGYSGHSTITNKQNHQIYLRGSVTRSYTGHDLNTVTDGWRGRRKRISVQRRGDDFTVKFSNWNEVEFNDDLTITLSLDDHPDLAKFKGPCQYGYYNHSQRYSSYHDINFYSSELNDVIVNAQNNTVYKYREGIGWELLSDVKAQDIYGAPRTLINKETNESFRLNVDGTITKL